jgi:RimJ/RimL family protein N-acetyltransferase
MPPTILKGNGFALRRWGYGDEQSLAAHANNRAVWRNLRDTFPHPYTLSDAHGWIGARESDQEPLGQFAIEVAGDAVGGIGFEPGRDVHARTAEIGYWLGQPYWGRGIATEALGLMTAYAFETFHFDRVEAHVFDWNPASARVLEKCGYTREGRLRNKVFKDGQVIDDLIYARYE